MFIKDIDIEKFSYISLPKFLLDKKYEKVSSNAKLAYSCFLSYQKLSELNGYSYADENGKPFLIYTNQRLQDTLRISNKTATKVLKELKECELCHFKKVKSKSGHIINRIYISKVQSDFTFYQIPTKLLDFELRSDAVILYGILFDMLKLSFTHGSAFKDEEGNYYVFISVQQVMDFLNVGNQKAISLLNELEDASLIKRMKAKGFTNQKRIYLLKFWNDENEENLSNSEKTSDNDKKPLKTEISASEDDIRDKIVAYKQKIEYDVITTAYSPEYEDVMSEGEKMAAREKTGIFKMIIDEAFSLYSDICLGKEKRYTAQYINYLYDKNLTAFNLEIVLDIILENFDLIKNMKGYTRKMIIEVLDNPDYYLVKGVKKILA